MSEIYHKIKEHSKIVETVFFETEDGREFDDRDAAILHQAEIDIDDAVQYGNRCRNNGRIYKQNKLKVDVVTGLIPSSFRDFLRENKEAIIIYLEGK